MVDMNFQQPNNRVLAASEKATYSEIARWACVGGLFLALILTYAWLQNEILNLQYQMEQVKKESSELRELNEALRVEYSSMVAPEKIDRVAKELGLISSNRVEVTILHARAPSAAPAARLVAESRSGKRSIHE